MGRLSFTIIWNAALFIASCLVPALAEDVDPEAPATSVVRHEIVERTKREFHKVVFYKPAHPDGGKIEARFAPLIVEEVAEKVIGTIHTVKSNANKKLPAIYVRVAEAKLAESKLEEVVYWWLHEEATETEFATSQTVFMGRGVRVVLGPDGMPVLWEALGDSESHRVFFVAQSLERAAAQQFGKPMPGRNFSIERGVHEASNVVVARILDDGPVPMGPYVYLEACSRSITTILCRCMASQFDDVLETLEYQMEPLDRLDPKSLGENRRIAFETAPNLEPLSSLFRWPKLEEAQPNERP